METIDEEIEAARARLEAKKAELKAVEDAKAKEQELNELLRQEADSEAIRVAREAHTAGEIETVHTELGVVIVKRPKAPTYNRFRDESRYDTGSMKSLVLPCLVHPSKEEFDSLISELPAVLDRVADTVVSLAGRRERSLAGKA